jgi:hypothetical protein
LKHLGGKTTSFHDAKASKTPRPNKILKKTDSYRQSRSCCNHTKNIPLAGIFTDLGEGAHAKNT